MYPEKVYHCSCMSLDIKLCLVNRLYSLKDICKKLNQTNGDKIYCSKCGDKNQYVIFSCLKHMAMVVFYPEMQDGYLELTEQNKNCCLRCIQKYLRIAYHCCYDYTNFDLPTTIKKEKKTLCLRLCKF